MKSMYSIGLLCLWGLTANAATWHVATNGVDNSDPGRGESWALPYATISNAVSAAADQETILVSNGLYAITAAIAVTKNITLRSIDDNPTNTIVDANYLDRCFSMTSVTNATLSGFTLQHGTNSSNGGGVYFNATGTVQNCIFTENVSSDSAGGLFMLEGIVSNCLFYGNTSTLTPRSKYCGGGGLMVRRNSRVVDCVIRDNESSSDGGGAYIYDYAHIIHCTVVSNKTTDSSSCGGGILLYGALTQITNCSVSFNTGSSGGGGAVGDLGGGMIANSRFLCNTGTYGGGVNFTKHMAWDQGNTLLDCDLIGNSAAIGGGIYYAQYVTNNLIRRCRVQDNRTTGNGGGLYCANANSNVLENLVITGNSSGSDYGGLYLTGQSNLVRNCLIAMNTANNYGGVYAGNRANIENCTIVSNVAATNGGGLYCNWLDVNSCVLNTIVYHNSATTYANWRRVNSDVTFSNSCTTPSVAAYGTGNITNDPALVSLNEGNYRLARGSPCINTGLSQDWMTGATDLDGRPRIGRFDSGPVDMGCYEYLNADTFFFGR